MSSPGYPAPALNPSRINSRVGYALSQSAFAAERGSFTTSQIRNLKLHPSVDTTPNAPADENAYRPAISLGSHILGSYTRQRPKSFFCNLPNEIILGVLDFLSVEGILSLRMACKRMYSITKLRYVWHSALHRHVVDKGLPVPSPRTISGTRYHTASSFDLEARAVHATRLHANYLSSNPRITRAVQLQTGSAPRGYEDEPLPRGLTSIKHIAFFDGGHGQQYLVAAFSLDCLGCWEISLDSGNIFHVAQWQSTHTISRVLVNENAENTEGDSHGIIAVASQTAFGLKVTVLSLDTFRGHFLELGTVTNQTSSALLAFKGFFLAFAEDNCLIHWRASFTCRLQSDPRVIAVESQDLVFSMTFIDDDYILLAGPQSFQLFLVPSVQASRKQIFIHPVMSFPLPFPVREVALSGYYPQTHGAPLTVSGQTRRHPVSALLHSQEDGFNVVHHYVFELEPRQSDGSSPPRPIQFPPILVRTIPVPPSCSKLFLSPSGRGYWLETRNLGSKRRSYVARCIVPLCITSTATQQIASDHGIHEEWHVDLKIGTNPLYERQCGFKDLKEGKQRISAVALEDSVGRMAVGDIDGGIVVMDFA